MPPINSHNTVHKTSSGQPKIEPTPVTTAPRPSSNVQMRVVTNGISVNRSGGGKTVASNPAPPINAFSKRADAVSESLHQIDEQKLKKAHVSGHTATPYAPRVVPTSLEPAGQENPSRAKSYGTKIKSYPSSEARDPSQSVYRTNSVVATSLPLRVANHQPPSPLAHHENHSANSSAAQHERPASRNEAVVSLTMARKALEQQQHHQHQSIGPKIPPINFPPLRAPQSIVDVRHPFVTEARTKHSETAISSVKSKPETLQSGMKELYAGQTFHGYGTSTIAGMPSIQSLGNVAAASISPYVRADSYGQPTVANVQLFPETAQFPQSPPFSAAQVGQINQYPTYDPASYASTQVNPAVMTQYSGENSLAYPQYESQPQFVPTNHYATSEIANSQYQYQTAGVGQIQESPVYLQSVQSSIAVTEQYAASNYARAVRAELVPRLHRPPRFNK